MYLIGKKRCPICGVKGKIWKKDIKIFVKLMTKGVLPVPPAVMLPTEITGTVIFCTGSRFLS